MSSEGLGTISGREGPNFLTEGTNIQSNLPTRPIEEIEAEKRSLERISKADRENVIGLDLWLREQAKERAQKPQPNGAIDHTPKFVVDGYIYRPRRPDLIPHVSLEEAIVNLDKTVKSINDLKIPELTDDWTVIRDSRAGLSVYLQETIRANKGEELSPYDSFVSQVAGYDTRLIPNPTLDNGLLKIADILGRMGEVASEGPHSTDTLRRAAARRSDRTRLSNKDFKNAFRRAEFRNRARLSEILGHDLSKVNFDFTWEQDDAFWMFWEEIGLEGDRLRVNEHERHDPKRDIGYAGMYGGHEPAHFYQAHEVRTAIKDKKLDPSVGLLLIPGPACYQLEGLAQTVGDLAGFETTLDEKLAVELYRLEKRALSNALIYVHRGNSIEEVAKWLQKYALKNRLAVSKKLLEEGTTKPFERAYLGLYGRVDYDLMQLNDAFGDISPLIPIWFRTPQTPDRMIPQPMRQVIKYADAA
ncbi:MAG: hypothetical protein AAB512_01385 [Patescibacteria group bacterium]